MLYDYNKKTQKIYENDDFRCRYCGKDFISDDVDDFINTHIDHIRPKKRGGEDSEDNVATTCTACHTLKQKIDNEFDFDSAPKERESLVEMIAVEIAKKRKQVRKDLEKARRRFR